jgi:RNA polymerase sigma-70 factor (ECF subfamily)
MEPEMEDLQAIRRLKRGDISGLECLIAHYQGKALRTAFLITHDEPTAEDVVQDVFVRFYQRVDQFDETRCFEPYFLRSVVNAALNCMERENRHQALPEADAGDVELLLEQAASLEEQVEFHAIQAQLSDALIRLSPRQRAVIVQRYYLEMSEKEMSETLGSPPGTVKWLLSAARDRLWVLLSSERMDE